MRDRLNIISLVEFLEKENAYALFTLKLST
jgi:hypothetical protein